MTFLRIRRSRRQFVNKDKRSKVSHLVSKAAKAEEMGNMDLATDLLLEALSVEERIRVAA